MSWVTSSFFFYTQGYTLTVRDVALIFGPRSSTLLIGSDPIQILHKPEAVNSSDRSTKDPKLPEL